MTSATWVGIGIGGFILFWILVSGILREILKPQIEELCAKQKKLEWGSDEFHEVSSEISCVENWIIMWPGMLYLRALFRIFWIPWKCFSLAGKGIGRGLRSVFFNHDSQRFQVHPWKGSE